MFLKFYGQRRALSRVNYNFHSRVVVHGILGIYKITFFHEIDELLKFECKCYYNFLSDFVIVQSYRGKSVRFKAKENATGPPLSLRLFLLPLQCLIFIYIEYHSSCHVERMK